MKLSVHKYSFWTEKYIICKRFRKPTDIKKILDYIRNTIVQKYCDISDIIDKNIIYDTLYHVVMFNKTFVDLQIMYIIKTLEIIKTNLFNKRLHVDTCLKWCKRYHIPIKYIYETHNTENIEYHTIDKFVFNGLVGSA